MSPLTTHVLDTARGVPAAQLAVTLDQLQGDGQWKELGKAVTNDDGRAPHMLMAGTRLVAGTYRLTFDTESYFRLTGSTGFYPHVTVVFVVKTETAHLHVPLLLSPYGYSTYRGS